MTIIIGKPDAHTLFFARAGKRKLIKFIAAKKQNPRGAIRVRITIPSGMHIQDLGTRVFMHQLSST